MQDLTKPIFCDADKAREHLEALRWPEGPVCPHCGAHEGIAAVEGKKKSHRKGLYYCNSCSGQFTVTVGTVLEHSRVPLNKWLMAFYLMCASKKGYSAHQLHRTLGVTYKTAWFMAHRIREAMRTGGLAPPALGGDGKAVEVDETFIGKKKSAKKFSKPHGSSQKMAVLTLVERGGNARSFHVNGTYANELMPIIKANIDRETKISTDQASYYNSMAKHFLDHGSVNHSKDEWRRGDICTNTVEGYFSIFKRGMKGVYQHCSEKHLHRYLAEFDFRYNNRSANGIEDQERTSNALLQIEGKRLTYRRIDRNES